MLSTACVCGDVTQAIFSKNRERAQRTSCFCPANISLRNSDVSETSRPDSSFRRKLATGDLLTAVYCRELGTRLLLGFGDLVGSETA